MVKIIGLIAAALFVVWLFLDDGGKRGGPVSTVDDKLAVESAIGSDEEYEMDLTERCKDWLYYRNRAYKLGKEGDMAGSAEASKTMRIFMRDLEKRFPEQVITEEIQRIEAEGFTLGF